MGRFLRQSLFVVLVVPITVVGWAFCMLGLLFPRRWRLDYLAGRVWAWCLLTVAGCRVTMEGREHVIEGEAHLVVANHASYLDPPMLIGWYPVPLRFVMKRELASMPFIGWYAKAAGHFFVDRERARSGRETVQAALERVREEHLSLIVFPEGTRSTDGRLQPLKTGSFELALAGGLPLQPVAVLGTHEVMPKGALGPVRWGRATIRIGPPIRWEGLSGSAGRRALAEQTRQALLALGVPPQPEAPKVEPTPPGS